jgi:hypothetical protein
MIAYFHLGHIRSDCGDDTGDFIAKDHRWLAAERASRRALVGMAEPGGAHINENLTPDGHGDVDVSELESLTEPADHGCLHGISLLFSKRTMPARAFRPGCPSSQRQL